MSELKTKKHDQDPLEFLSAVENETRRKDALVVLELMRKITGDKGSMWGTSIIGFGHYHYQYASGREGDWFFTGFSPRKTSLSLYIMPGFKRYQHLLAKLGKFKTGKACLYINKLQDVDIEVLERLITESVDFLKSKHSV